jgi:hypothetical protein
VAGCKCRYDREIYVDIVEKEVKIIVVFVVEILTDELS